jgi:hypothetical protein
MANVHLWSDTSKPFRFRLLVPWLASFVPSFGADPDRALVVQFAAVNIIGLTVAMFAIYRIALHYKFSSVESAFAGLLMLSCYPVLRFGGLPMIESPAYAVLALAVLLALRRRWAWFALVMLVGMLVKETTIFAALIAVLAVSDYRGRLRVVLASIPGVAAYSVLRWMLIPTPDGFNYDLQTAAGRFAALSHPGWFLTVTAQIVTSFGILWLFAAWGAWRNRADHVLPAYTLWAVPTIIVIAVIIHSSYGRICFLVFPVVILFALHGLRTSWRSLDRASVE